MKNTIRRVLGISVLLGASACIAGASTLTYYVDVFGGLPASTTFINPATATEAAAGASATLSIPKLNQTSDPNPGFIYALSAVSLQLNWISDGTVRIINYSCSFGFTDCVDIPFANASSNVPLTLTAALTTVVAPGVAGPVTSSSQTNCALSSPIPCAKYQGDGGPVNDFTGQHGSGSASNPGAPLSFFQGYGASNFTANAQNGVQSYSGNAALGFPSDLSFGGTSQTGAVFQVTYTYSEQAIPEPATLSLMGMALIGLGVLARAKNRKRV